MPWWLMEARNLETTSMSNAKIAMVKILQYQEIFEITSSIIRYEKILKIMTDILEIPVDGTANTDGWSILKPMEAIYIRLS